FLGLAGRELLAALMDDVAGLGIDQIVGGLCALPLLCIVGNAPALVGLFVLQRIVIGAQDFLGIHTESLEQRSDRNLAATVNACVDDVLGVEFNIEPGAAVGNDTAGEQQL